MINDKIDDDFLSQRQQYVFKGAVLLLCAAILAMVFLSGRQETPTADQCSQSVTRGSCLSDTSATSTYLPGKGALAALGANSSARGRG
jgi:hypothetical protein